MKLFILFTFLIWPFHLYSQADRLGDIQSNPENMPSGSYYKYYYAGEVGNRYGKHFEISFELVGSGVVVFYKKDYAIAYSGNRPQTMMIDNLLWFNSNNSYIPSPKNWVSTHRYNFAYPSIDDVEGNCSVQTESYPDRFLLHIYNSNGFNRIRLFLPFQIRR